MVSISVRLSFWKETWLMFYNVWQLKALLLDSQREKLSKKLSEADQRNRFLKRRVCIHEKLGVFFMKAWCSLASKKSFLYMVCLWFACILVFLLMLLFYWRFSIIFLTKAVLGICVAVKLCKKLKLKEQTKDVDTAPSKEVSLYVLVWHGRSRNARKLLNYIP